MSKRLRHLRRDERGMTFVFVGLGFVAFMSATTLAVDVGMFMTARSQAQNAADAGALGGATALAFNNFNDRTSTGPAVLSAINSAKSNSVMSGVPSVLPVDVTFPNDPFGNPTRVKVNVYRTTTRGNAIPTLVGPMFGVPTVSIGATATAEASPANAETCVMPFTIPDKWIEKQDPGGWTPSSTFDMFKKSGQPLPNPDSYVAPGQTGSTGYKLATDTGRQLVLKSNNSNNVSPSMYNPWDLPGSGGGSDYRNNIATCNTNIVKIGDFMVPENGNMVGPTSQGTNDLVLKDPYATWDTACNCVKGSAFPISPRIAIVPLYNPTVFEQGKQSGKSSPQLQVANYMGFFIQGVDNSGNVTGRITPIGGLVTGNGGPMTGAFPVAIRLVQ
jgi:Flp pilus assembly protein TadG